MIVKICKHHGSLTREQVNITSKNGGFKCKECQRLLAKKHYEANKEKVKAAHKKYKENNIEKYKEIKRNSNKKLWRLYKENKINKFFEKREQQRLEYYKKHRQKELERCSVYKKRQVALMSDKYMRDLILRSESGNRLLSPSEIPQEMIMIKRVILEISRRLRKQKETI